MCHSSPVLFLSYAGPLSQRLCKPTYKVVTLEMQTLEANTKYILSRLRPKLSRAVLVVDISVVELSGR